MSYWKLWILFLTADWTVRVLVGVFAGGGFAFSAETGLALLVLPALEAAALLGVFRVGRALGRLRRGPS